MYQSDDEAENRRLERKAYFWITWLSILLLIIIRRVFKHHKK